MNQFIGKTLEKFDRISLEAARELVRTAFVDIQLLENVINSIAQGILVCDHEHNIIITNIYAKHLIPIEDDDSGKKRAWQLVKDEQIRLFLKETLEAGVNVEEYEIEIDLKDVSRLLEFAVHPLVTQGRITGSVVLIADITEKRAKEARMRRIENLASLTTLAAGVAHEIKNPLAAISIHIHLLKKAMEKHAPSGADLGTHIDIVNDEIKRLNDIVVDFLFAVRPMELKLRLTDINEVAREVVRLESSEAEAEGIRCTCELAETLPPLKIDRQLIKQALVNLVKNAIEVMKEASAPPGTQKEIRLCVKAASGGVILSVTDTGPGIREGDISRIFEPYWTTKAGGSGLGLTLVFKIIQEHNGEIKVSSQAGEGTCFLISLPLPQKDTRLLPCVSR